MAVSALPVPTRADLPLQSSARVTAGSVRVAPVVEYGARRTLIVIGVMLAALLQTLDATIVNVALPTIEGNVGATIDDGTWIITGYIISNVVAIPLAPYFLQRFGRRQYYATSIVGFTVASFLCGTATTLQTLVAFRIIQGMFGGGLIATSQIILRDTFPPEKLGTSSALFAVALTFGPALGPTLGGALTDQFSWPWVFDINLVPGSIAALIVLTTLRNPTKPQRIPLDTVGIALLAVALGCMQYVLDEGERHDWFGDSGIVTLSIACAAGLGAFIWWELYGARRPIVDLRIFRYRNLRFGLPVALMLGMTVFGPTVLLPQYAQRTLGFTATLAGLLVLTRALPVLVLTPLVARVATRFDFRFPLALGFALSAVSALGLSSHMTTSSEFGTFFVWLVIGGIGQSMLLVPLLVGILGSVAPQDSPKASSFVSLSVQLGGSIISTLLITLFDRRTYFHSDILRGAVTLAHPKVRALAALPHGTVQLAALVRQQAESAGFADAIFFLLPLSALAVALSAMLQRRKPATGPLAPQPQVSNLRSAETPKVTRKPV
jgi:DHA2 family multidrug resistance protein